MSKLAESERIDPSNGTLLNLVLCEERLGKVASAWLHTKELLERLPANDARRPIAERRFAALSARLASSKCGSRRRHPRIRKSRSMASSWERRVWARAADRSGECIACWSAHPGEATGSPVFRSTSRGCTNGWPSQARRLPDRPGSRARRAGRCPSGPRRRRETSPERRARP